MFGSAYIQEANGRSVDPAQDEPQALVFFGNSMEEDRMLSRVRLSHKEKPKAVKSNNKSSRMGR